MHRLVDLDAAVGDLVGSTFLAEGLDWNGVAVRFALGIEPGPGGGCRVRSVLLDTLSRAAVTEMAGLDEDGSAAVLPAATPLRIAVQGVAEVDLRRAIPVEVVWPRNRMLQTSAFALLSVFGLVAICVAVSLHIPVLQFSVMALGLLAAPAGAILAVRRWEEGDPRPRILVQGHLVPRNEEGALLASGQAGPSPAERVEVVQAAYGALLSDVVYRIENSALFDAAVPQTQRFQIALVNWDADASDAPTLAADVEESFAAARTHAETLGLDHVPQASRAPAARAVKAVITALASRDEERDAAARASAALLAGLNLYYLPVIDPGTPSLIAARRELNR